MFRLLFLIAVLCLASPVIAATAPLPGTPTIAAVQVTEPDAGAFPGVLAAAMEGYRGFSEPVPPYPTTMAAQGVMLVALSLAIARALPRNRRRGARRTQAARAAVEISRMR